MATYPSTKLPENGSISPKKVLTSPKETFTQPGLTEAESGTVKTQDVPTTLDNSVPENRWPGWPGDCVYRLIVPVLKVGSIIGRKGELIKKLCEDTRARIRVLDGPVGKSDRIVLISGKEDREAPLSPAMDAVLRIFKRVSGLTDSEGDFKDIGASGVGFCSIRLLVPSTQGINLIGKQGSTIKSIQEGSGASVKVFSGEDVPSYVSSDEQIVEFQGEFLKVQKALESVVGHLRKFLVDHSVLFLFEKNYNTTSQDHQAANSAIHTSSQVGIGSEYSHQMKRDSLFFDGESHLESHLTPRYGQDHSLSSLRSSGLGRSGAPMVTQVVQTMQIPLSYAEDIIGVEGTNIGYIRRTSGAILTVQESRGLPDEITVEIKGTTSQIQIAQQLIQDFISNHRESMVSSYGNVDSGLRSYSQMENGPYLSQHYGGGYNSFRL